MDFRLTAEQELWKRMVREFAEKNIEPRAREIDEKEAGIPEEIIQGMAELGIFGVTIPEEYGGSAMPGQEMVYAMITIHELARAELSMSLPVYTLLCLGWGYLIVRYGTEELRREVLPKVASGECFVGINTTEPQGGSDVSGITTTAVKKGDKWVINGEKAYISGVTEATIRGGGHCTLVVTDPEKGHRGMTFIYIPANLPGITTTVYKDMGRMGLSTGGFIYKDVEVPDYCRLSEVGRGFHMNMEGFNVARIVVAAACTGAAEKMLEIGVDYTKQRILFGRPLLNFEGISFEIAEDHTDLEMTELLLQKAAWMVDQFYAGTGEFTKTDINKAVAMCKLRAPLLAARVAQHVMIQLGAFGYTKDCPVEMGLRGVLSYCVGAEGGQNIMKIIIARDYAGDEAVPYRGTQKRPR